MAYIGTAPSRSPLSSTQLDADLTLTDSLTITGSTPTVTIGDAGAEDTKLVFDGNAQDFYIGLDDGTDDLLIGLGSAVGTTPAIAIDENLDIVTSGVITTTVAHDGGDTSITINNSAAAGSTDETATLAFQHAGITGGKIVSSRRNDYSSAGGSKLEFYTANDGDSLVAQWEQATANGGKFLFNDTANTFNSAGITINQKAADDEVFTCKSSDVSIGITGVTEADTFFTIAKRSSTLGGAHISAYAEDSSSISEVLTLNARGGQANTSKATNSQGLIVAHAREISGSGDADVAADGNAFGVVVERSGRKLVFIVDEDGDIHNDGADSAAYDAYDDAALLRGLELWRGDENEKTVKPQLLASRFDGNRYTKEQLEGAKVIQVQTKEEWDKGVRSLINTSTQSRVTTGAIWQNHEMLDAIITTLEKENSGFTAKLKKEFVARGLPTQILDWTGDIPDDLVKPDVAPKAFNAE